MKTIITTIILLSLQGCMTAVAVVDVAASTVVYTGKAVVGIVTPNFDKKEK